MTLGEQGQVLRELSARDGFGVAVRGAERRVGDRLAGGEVGTESPCLNAGQRHGAATSAGADDKGADKDRETT